MNPNTLLLPTVWPRAAPTTLHRCVLLALLAHVWLVLTLGHAPGGTAQPGEGVWGAVNVTLRGPATPGALDLPTPPVPAVATGPAGLAETPRWGGAVRPQPASEAPPEPGAAQLGRWAPLPEPAAAEPALTPLPRATVQRPALPTGPLPEPGRVVEERAVAPPPERTLASSLAGPLAPAAPAAPAVSAAAALSATTPVAALPARLPDLLAPSAAPLMAPRAAPPPLAAAVAALPSAQPVATPLVLAGPPPVALNSLNAPVAPLAVPVAAVPQPVSAPVPLSAPAPAPAVAAAALLPPAASPFTAGLPSGGAPAGTADAGTRLGHDVAGAPALPASAPPRLNLQLARPRGGEISRGLGGGMLAVLPRPPEVDDKLGRQIAKTAKVDCRSAYAGAGLLAVVPLAAEALRKDSNCKW